MPIYEYACMECEEHFEELVRNAEQVVACPSCGAAKVLRQFSVFATVGTQSKPTFAGPTGGARGGGCCGGGCGCG
jgi:putative FmdB family regulatory protein